MENMTGFELSINFEVTPIIQQDYCKNVILSSFSQRLCQFKKVYNLPCSNFCSNDDSSDDEEYEEDVNNNVPSHNNCEDHFYESIDDETYHDCKSFQYNSIKYNMFPSDLQSLNQLMLMIESMLRDGAGNTGPGDGIDICKTPSICLNCSQQFDSAELSQAEYVDIRAFSPNLFAAAKSPKPPKSSSNSKLKSCLKSWSIDDSESSLSMAKTVRFSERVDVMHYPLSSKEVRFKRNGQFVSSRRSLFGTSFKLAKHKMFPIGDLRKCK